MRCPIRSAPSTSRRDLPASCTTSSLPTLLAAYRRGLYPLAHLPPLKWWSPPERSLLFFEHLHISNNLRRLMRQGRYTVTFDRDFEQVIAACAGRREGRWHLTWITPRIMRVYAEAFDAGYAHSFEVWNKAGELVAGGYGIGIGAAFTSESQFFRESNASQDRHDRAELAPGALGLPFQRRQADGPALEQHGLPRRAAQRIPGAPGRCGADAPGKPGRWQVEADLDTVSRWEPDAAPGSGAALPSGGGRGSDRSGSAPAATG